MAVATVKREMLYCPKCNATYQDGTQRFCSTDGSRLVSATVAKSPTNSQGVFTSLLSRAASNNQNDEKLSSQPVKTEVRRNEPPVFHTSFSSKVFRDENLTVQKKEETPINQVNNTPLNNVPIQTQQPVVRLIKPNEIASGTAEVGDRKTNPTGRLALTWENPRVLLGQTIKGRYYVVEKLDQDDSSIVYLAEDKIIPNKNVVVRVLMEEKKDAFLSKIFSEERVSLSHINHPNVVGVLDSGELLEGLPFVVSESVDGFSLKEKLQKLEQFNPLRTGRIIRQASYALSEVHQNGILHRSLRPSNIYLTVSEIGTEQVKVADFVVSNGAKKQNIEQVKYLSPEQIEGKMPNFASDIYSLAVVAYQMLTGSMPYDFTTADKLLKAQKEKLYIAPSKLRSELSKSVDDVFAKALSYNPADRYPKARDFGDALFNALSLTVNPENAIEIQGVELKEESNSETVSSTIRIPSLKESKVEDTNQLKIEAKEEAESDGNSVTKISAPTSELTWEKRSPEPVKPMSPIVMGLIGLGILLLGLFAYQSWSYFKNRQIEPEVVVSNPTPAIPQGETPVTPIPNEIESPPLPRNVSQPPNTEYFQNSKSEQKDRTDLLKNYRGFTLFYPSSWTKNSSKTNFLDISKKSENGSLLEQMLITSYPSTGLFSKDKELFPKLVEKSNKDLKAVLGDNYKVVSQGEVNIQNGRWKVYEVTFQSSGKGSDGKELMVWGRRIWLPTQNPTMRNGFVITMLATSLSSEITKLEDVGNKGDLATILETFEPSTAD
jgi:serine/threonine protein kinase